MAKRSVALPIELKIACFEIEFRTMSHSASLCSDFLFSLTNEKCSYVDVVQYAFARSSLALKFFSNVSMSFVDLIPLNKGNRVRLDVTKPIVIIGRNRDIGCDDQRVSRQHTEISLKPDGTVSIKGIHLNPTFFKSKTNQIVRLTKDKEYFLSNDDEFGFLPDEYFFRISIETISQREEPTSSSRATEETTNNNTSVHVESKKTNLIYDDDTDDEVEATQSKGFTKFN